MAGVGWSWFDFKMEVMIEGDISEMEEALQCI